MGETVLFAAILKKRAKHDPHTNPELIRSQQLSNNHS
jgi:hypothetical protein